MRRGDTQPTQRPNGNGPGFGITSERAMDISDLTEPSEVGRRREDGTRQARPAEPKIKRRCKLPGVDRTLIGGDRLLDAKSCRLLPQSLPR